MGIETQIQNLAFPASLPQTLLEVEQRFDAPRVADIPAAVARALEESGILSRIPQGASVAVAVGSRGIVNLPIIVRAAIARLREHGAEPFIIPAMGSHGGATAEGQREMLAELSVTPESAGAEIRATMEVRPIGSIPGGPNLYQDVLSAAANCTLLINRVKPHTDFRGTIESGLAKMLVIGLGKQAGAVEMHSYGGAGFERFLAPAARIYRQNTNIVGGLAILENACDETADIVGLTADEIGGPREVELTTRAKALLASIPIPEIEVLAVRHLGKNISGTGMDTNIIGRLRIPRQPENRVGPDIAVIAVLDLTAETNGNAAGIGLANVTTLRAANKIDWTATYTNAVTSGIFGMDRVSQPITMADDRRCLEVALRGCGRPQEQARFVFIRDTLSLDRLWVSPNLRETAQAHPRLSIAREVPLSFDPDGAMTSPWEME